MPRLHLIATPPYVARIVPVTALPPQEDIELRPDLLILDVQSEFDRVSLDVEPAKYMVIVRDGTNTTRFGSIHLSGSIQSGTIDLTRSLSSGASLRIANLFLSLGVSVDLPEFESDAGTVATNEDGESVDAVDAPAGSGDSGSGDGSGDGSGGKSGSGGAGAGLGLAALAAFALMAK